MFGLIFLIIAASNDLLFDRRYVMHQIMLMRQSFVDVPLHWQQWRHGSTALDSVAAAIQEAARALR